MKKPRSSIFLWILLATLLPLVFIFSMVLMTINKIIFQSSVNFAQEKTIFFARQVSGQVSTTLSGLAELNDLTARNIGLIADNSEHARTLATSFLKTMIQSNKEIYYGWLCFEPGAFSSEKRFAHAYFQKRGKIVEFPTMADGELDSAEATPWYNIPLRTGEPYFDNVERYDYGLGDGLQYIATITYPVKVGEETVGCVGADLLYEKTFSFIDEWQEESEHHILLLAEDGTILYSPSGEYTDKSVKSLAFADDFKRSMENALLLNKPLMRETFSPVSNQTSLACVYPIDVPGARTKIFAYFDMPTALVYREANASVQIVISTSVIGLLLLAASLFFATRNIVNPIKTLTTNADWIANGQLDVVFDDFDEHREPRHEVDMLEISIKKMLEQLSQNHELKIIAMEAEYEKQKMEEASAAKTRFFANMSHEIRTPMNAILGMSEILLTEELTDAQTKYVKDIKISSEALLDIVNDILDLSRLESGKMPLVSVNFDFMELLENIYSLSIFLARKKELTFDLKTQGNIPNYLFGDDVRLRQIVVNLISNAIKFTDDGGIILKVVDDNDTLRFDVIDTGIGVKDEDMEYLFESFRQLDGTKTRSIKGTGLGLSICLNLVDLMGGAMSVMSDYGHGSTFRFWIPKTIGVKPEIETPTENLPEKFSADSRILVVDDSRINLHVAVGLLKIYGIKADTADSGAEAIDMLAGTEYDLVFMDHMMPEMDGVETTKQIRALGGRFATVPIVALTANAVIGSRELFINSGMNDFLAKPIEKHKLQIILAKWMSAERALYDDASAPAVDGETDNVLPRRPAAETTFLSKAAVAKRLGDLDGETGSEQLSTLLTQASVIEGLDVRLGLSRVSGQQDLYEKLLWLVCETAPQIADTIAAAQQQTDLIRFTIEIHGAKGSLASIGAMPLSHLAAELEQNGKAGDAQAIESRLPRFLMHFKEFTDGLRTVLTGEQAAVPMPAGDKSGLGEKVLRLKKVLQDFDYEASQKIISKLTGRDYGEETNEKLRALHQLINAFNYDAAVEYIAAEFEPKLL